MHARCSMHCRRAPALTQAAAGGCAHAGQDDHIQLLALERVHRLDEHLRGKGEVERGACGWGRDQMRVGGTAAGQREGTAQQKAAQHKPRQTTISDNVCLPETNLLAILTSEAGPLPQTSSNVWRSSLRCSRYGVMTPTAHMGQEGGGI